MPRHAVWLSILSVVCFSTACGSQDMEVVTDGAVTAPISRTPKATTLTAADMQVSPCEDPSEWIVIDHTDNPSKPRISVASMPGDYRQGKGALQIDYVRQPNKMYAFVRPILLTDFQKIELDLWSKESTLAVLTVEDRDKATFNYPVKLQGGQWSHVTITPADFKLNDDSKVKKDRLDSSRLTGGIALLDFGPMMGASGPNSLRVDQFIVQYPHLAELNVPAEITQQLEIKSSGTITHPIVIRKGGGLKLSAPRLVLSSNIAADGGTLEFSNGVVSLNGRFPHDLNYAATNGGTIRFQDCFVTANYMCKLATNNSTLEVTRTEVHGPQSFTTNVENNSKAKLTAAKNFGEIILDSGGQLDINDSHNILVWTAFHPGAAVSFAFPPSAHITSWSLPNDSPIKLSVTNSKNISWALISTPTSTVNVSNSALRAIGLVFAQPKFTKVWGIQTTKAAADNAGTLDDRNLRLPGTTVDTWNVYTVGEANIEIKDCRIGEFMAFQNSKAAIMDSTIDGTGGYLAAGDNSTVSVFHSTLSCAVTSTSTAKLAIDKTPVTGPLVASGKSAVVLTGSPVFKGVSKVDQAQIDQVTDKQASAP